MPKWEKYRSARPKGSVLVQKKVGLFVTILLMCGLIVTVISVMISAKNDLSKYIIADEARARSDEYYQEQMQENPPTIAERIANSYNLGKLERERLDGAFSEGYLFEGKRIFVEKARIEMAEKAGKYTGYVDARERAVDENLRREALYCAAVDAGYQPDSAAVDAAVAQYASELARKLESGDSETEFLLRGARMTAEEYAELYREDRLKESAIARYLKAERAAFLTNNGFSEWSEEARASWDRYDEEIVAQVLRKDRVRYCG